MSQALYYVKQQFDRIYSNNYITKLYFLVRIIKEDNIQTLELIENLILNGCTSIEYLLKNNAPNVVQIRVDLGIKGNLNDELLLIIMNKINLIEYYESKREHQKFKELIKEAQDYIKQDFNKDNNNNQQVPTTFNNNNNNNNNNNIYNQSSDSSKNDQDKKNLESSIDIKQDQNIITYNTQQIELKQCLNLPLIKQDIQSEKYHPQYRYYSKQMNDIAYKNIIFIGQRGEGKTTLLNAFVNYYFDIKYDDKFRLIVADQIQTDNIQHYYIEPYSRQYGFHLIDTPGNYGRDDYETINKLSQFIKSKISEIDAIVVCINASYFRLTIETKQMLKSLVDIIGTSNIEKVKIARTFYNGCGGDLDDSIFKDQESPLFALSNSLTNNYHLEFNGSAALIKTVNIKAKYLYDINMQNFKQFEFEKYLQTQQANKVNQNNVVITPKVQDYQQILSASFDQLKQLFLQIVQAYDQNCNLILNKNYQGSSNVQSLQKQVIKIDNFAINCNNCQITCFIGFKTQDEAKSFIQSKLNGQSYCGCNFSNSFNIINEQWIYNLIQISCQYNEIQNSQSNLKRQMNTIFQYLFKLNKIRIPNTTQTEQQFIFELQQQDEQKDNKQLLEQYQNEILSQQNQKNPQHQPFIIFQQQQNNLGQNKQKK